MSRFRDFDAARSETVGPPLSFRLGGADFTCKPYISAGPILALATRSELSDLDAIRAFGGFLREIIVDDDSEKLADVLNRVPFEALFDVVQWVLEETTGRPLSSATASGVPPPEVGATSSNGSSTPAESPTP